MMIFPLPLRLLLVWMGALCLIAACQNGETASSDIPADPETKGATTMTMQLTSPAFQDKGMIPAQYSCDGKDVSPALAWSGAPGGTQSFALICDDPDAPNGDWVHWVLYDLPATVNELSEAYPRDKEPGGGAKHGLNSWRRYGYGGPCPPSGTHRYFFKLYALDCQLGLPAGKTKTELLDAMKDHVLAETQLMGRYKRH